MIVSLAGFWTAFIFVFFLSIGIYFLSKCMGGYQKIYPCSLLGCAFLIILRLLAPFEMQFSKNIFLFEILPGVKRILTYTLFTSANIEISVLHVIIALWGIVSLFKIDKLCGDYIRMQRHIKSLNAVDLSLAEKLHKDEQAFRLCPRISYKVSDMTKVPHVFGIWHPTIVFPCYMTGMPYGKIYFATLHEWGHIKYKDPLITLVLRFFFCVFWWIPFHSKLYTLIEDIREMRADMFATKNLEYDRTTQYMLFLLEITQLASKESGSVQTLNFFIRGQVDSLYKRLDSLRNPNKHFGRSAFLVVISINMFFLSYAFTFEPYYTSNDGTFSCTNKCVLIENGNNTYEVYMDGVSVGLVDDISFAESLKQQGIQISIEKR